MKRRFLVFLCLMLLIGLPALAADSPQWRGADRDGVFKETGLLASWPKGGPELVWTAKNTGLGYSSPSIVGNRIYTMGARNEHTYIICLDAKNGQEIWSTKIAPIFTFKDNLWGDGPRSTPTVDGNHVYGLSGDGTLACVTADKGTLVWKKNFPKDLGGEMMTEWGFSESVLIDGDKVICVPGGKKGAVAALNKKTGAVLWRCTDLTGAATYSSVRQAKIGGILQYVVLTYVSDTKGAAVSGVSAKDGKLLWRYHPGNYARASYSVAPTPLIRGDEVYVSAGYGAGCMLLKITKNGEKFEVTNKYRRRQQGVMKNTHGGVVRVGDYVYGHSERSGWVCQNWNTGKEKWYDRFKLQCTSGALVAADDNLYLYTDEGVAALIAASPEGWNEKGKLTIPQKSKLRKARPTGRQAKIWTHPVIANGKLYLRDQEYLFCYDIKK